MRCYYLPSPFSIVINSRRKGVDPAEMGHATPNIEMSWYYSTVWGRLTDTSEAEKVDDVCETATCAFTECFDMQEDSDASIQKTFKHRPYQQQCPSNIVECCKLNDPFDNVECCIVLSTKSKQIEHVQFVSTLSKGRNFTILVRHCCRLWQRSRMLLRQSPTWLRHCCWCGRGFTLH